MRPYFLNVNQNERKNILDLHKTPYDGYVVNQQTSNTQPLMVQDFANDKGGITVKSNGDVSEYNNKIYMKESSGECDECGYNEMEEININDLEKGKKYKYKKPNIEDELEFEDEIRYPSGEKMYSFGGMKDKGHLIGKHDIEKFLNMSEEMDEESKVCNECGMYEGICECGGNMVEDIDDIFDFSDNSDDYISLGSSNRLTYNIDSDDEISEPFVDSIENEDDELYMIVMDGDSDESSPVFERKEIFKNSKMNESIDKSLDMFKRILR